MALNGAALAADLAGASLLWSALNNKSLLAPVKAVIKGQSPQPGPATSVAASSPVATAGIPGVTVGIPAGVAASGGSPSVNKVLGKALATAYGWGTGANWAYLESGWEEESGWNEHAAYNHADPYNYAYGIPQANPGSKMATAGSDWKDSASTQIKWGLDYIKRTYGSPVQVPGWSANGPVSGYVGY
jgi:hypothetical protein